MRSGTTGCTLAGASITEKRDSRVTIRSDEARQPQDHLGAVAN